jgi:hypothetical protein
MSDVPPANEHLETAEHIAHGSTKGGLNGAVIPLSIAVMAVIAAAFGTCVGLHCRAEGGQCGKADQTDPQLPALE